MRPTANALLAAVIMGCDHGPPGGSLLAPTQTNVTGTFELTAVSNGALPVLISDDIDGKVELTGEQFVLAPNGTWSDSAMYRVRLYSEGAQRMTPVLASGTYALSGSQINFVRTSGATATFFGTVRKDLLNIAFERNIFSYQRR